MAEALRSADNNRETLSEAGLPLANLAFGEALRYASSTGPSEELWDALRRQVLRAPSPLIPALLDQLEELAGTNTTLQAGVEAWRTLWNARLKLHDIAEARPPDRQAAGPHDGQLLDRRRPNALALHSEPGAQFRAESRQRRPGRVHQ